MASCLTTGRARAVLRLVPTANGFEAYRRVLLAYEPRAEAQSTSMLVGVMKPKCSGQPYNFADIGVGICSAKV
eukprot:16435735-Heterocapsa_arctica.AAC.1